MSLVLVSITAAELVDRVGTPNAPRILDTRRREVFDAAERMIPGSKWRHHRAVDDWRAELAPAEEVVVCCVHGHQVSESAAARLRAGGINARKLAGGIEGYIEAGGMTILKSERLPGYFEGGIRWITRQRPKVDRLACPWFIKRFVDPAAEILYAEADWVKESALELDAVPFDIPETAFGHEGEKCSFDVFLDRFDVRDTALRRVAEIVRGADTDRLDLAPEAAGLLAMSLGISAANDDDHAALAQGMVLYDALYAWSRKATAETHNWPSAVIR